MNEMGKPNITLLIYIHLSIRVSFFFKIYYHSPRAFSLTEQTCFEKIWIHKREEKPPISRDLLTNCLCFYTS